MADPSDRVSTLSSEVIARIVGPWPWSISIFSSRIVRDEKIVLNPFVVVIGACTENSQRSHHKVSELTTNLRYPSQIIFPNNFSYETKMAFNSL